MVLYHMKPMIYVANEGNLDVYCKMVHFIYIIHLMQCWELILFEERRLCCVYVINVCTVHDILPFQKVTIFLLSKGICTFYPCCFEIR